VGHRAGRGCAKCQDNSNAEEGLEPEGPSRRGAAVRCPLACPGSWSQCMRKSETGLSMNRPIATRAREASPSPLRKGRGSGRGVPSLVPVHGPNACAKSERGLSMNRANCDARCRSFSLAPSEGERVGVRGPFSRPQVHGPNACAESETGLSMNRPNCHARRRRFSLSPSEGERVGVRASVQPILEGARGPFARTGSRSQCMRKSETGLPMNRRPADTHPRSDAPGKARLPPSRPQVHCPNACAKAKVGLP